MDPEVVFLADIAFKGKRKKKSIKDKKKKVKNGIVFKWISAKNRRRNECDKVDDDIHAIPNFFDEDNPYKEAKCSQALGKSLGLYAENDDDVIKALVETRKGNEEEVVRPRQRQKKGCNKRTQLVFFSDIFLSEQAFCVALMFLFRVNLHSVTSVYFSTLQSVETLINYREKKKRHSHLLGLVVSLVDS